MSDPTLPPTPVAPVTTATTTTPESGGNVARTLWPAVQQANANWPRGLDLTAVPAAIGAQLTQILSDQHLDAEAFLRQALTLAVRDGQMTLTTSARSIPEIVLARPAAWLDPLLPAAQGTPTASPDTARPIADTYRRPLAFPPATPSTAPVGNMATPSSAPLATIAREAASIDGEWFGQRNPILRLNGPMAVQVPPEIVRQLPAEASPLRITVTHEQLQIQPLRNAGSAHQIALPPALIPRLTSLFMQQPPQLERLQMPIQVHPGAAQIMPDSATGTAPIPLSRWPQPLPETVTQRGDQRYLVDMRWTGPDQAIVRWNTTPAANTPPMPVATQVLSGTSAHLLAQLFAGRAPVDTASSVTPGMVEQTRQAPPVPPDVWRQQLPTAEVLNRISADPQLRQSPPAQALFSALPTSVPDTSQIAAWVSTLMNFNALTAASAQATSPPLGQVALWLQLLLGGRTIAAPDERLEPGVRRWRDRAQQWLESPLSGNERTEVARLLGQLGNHVSLQQSRTEDGANGLQMMFTLPIRQRDDPPGYADAEAQIKEQKQANGRSGWQLRLRLPVGADSLLVQAQLIGKSLELQCYASTAGVLTQAEKHLPTLCQRLADGGLTITSAACQLGAVPPTLDGSRPHRLLEVKV